MAFSAIKTFVDGLVLTAAELNTYLSANTDWLKNGIGWMGASDSGDGSRTAQQARTAMIGADLMTPVNSTPVDLTADHQYNLQRHRDHDTEQRAGVSRCQEKRGGQRFRIMHFYIHPLRPNHNQHAHGRSKRQREAHRLAACRLMTL